MSAESNSLVSDGVVEFFKRNRFAKVFIPLLPGNHGDELMRIALYAMVKKFEMQAVRSVHRADWILIRGNGAMNQFWRNAWDALRYYSEEYPEIPVVVFPSSYDLEREQVCSVLQKRESTCILYAREKPSYARLESMSLPTIAKLDMGHDTALFLKKEPLVERLIGVRESRSDSHAPYILLVERCDVEHFRGGALPVRQAKLPLSAEPLAKSVLRFIGRQPRRAWLRYKWQRDNGCFCEPCSEEFRAESMEAIREHFPEFCGLKSVCGDISDPLKYSFNQFCSSIALASVVVTTRLHVGLLSAMIGVPTVLRTGKTDKILGVWELSLRSYENVVLVGGGKS